MKLNKFDNLALAINEKAQRYKWMCRCGESGEKILQITETGSIILYCKQCDATFTGDLVAMLNKVFNGCGKPIIYDEDPR